jgi:hypothetical protein
MSTQFVQYPQNAGGSGTTGSQTGVPYFLGSLDAATKTPQGGTIGSNAFYQQSADATFPGLVSSANQTFSGTKTFLQTTSVAGIVSSGTVQGSLLLGTNLQVSASITAGDSIVCSNSMQASTGTFTGLTSGAPVKSGASGLLVNGSISLSNQVSGILPSSMVSGSASGVAYVVGALDGAASNNLGATIGSSTFYQQSATASVPGVVSSGNQTFAGVKTFNAPVLLSHGTVTVPSLAFGLETNSGLYYIGTNSYAFSVSGLQAMNFVTSTGNGFANVGMGGSASTSPLFPMSISRTQDGGFLTQALSNLSSVAGSGGRLQALVDNGVNSAEVIATSINTAAPDVYAGGRAVFRSAGNMTGINFLCGATDGTTKFYVGGNGTATEVSATVNSGGFYAKTVVGAPAHRVGSMTMTSSVGGASYGIAWPGAQGAASTVPTNDGSGNLSWAPTLTNPLTTSGDLIVSSGSGIATRFAALGSTGMSLTLNSSSSLGVTWGVPLLQYNFPDTSSAPANFGANDQAVIMMGWASSTLSSNLPDPQYNNGKRVVITNTNVSNSSSGSYSIKALGSATLIVDGKDLGIGGGYTYKTRSESTEWLAVASTNAWYCINRQTETAWQPYVPPNTQGLGSLTATSFVWRRDGPDLLIMGAGYSGTVTASEAQFSLPQNFTTDSGVLSSGDFLVGTFALAGTGVQYPTVIARGGKTFLTFASQNSGTGSLVPANGSTVIGNTTRFSINVRVPISIWSL